MIPDTIFRRADQFGQDARLRLAAKLIGNGFEPVPIYAQEKKPFIRDWQCPAGEPVTLERVCEQMIRHPDHHNIGLLTRRLPSIDVDIPDKDHARLVIGAVEYYLGTTPFKRFGSKGAMLCYRSLDGETAPAKRVIADSVKEGESKAKTLVEFFGDRNQFVAYGIHPTTNRQYRWLNKGSEPLLIPWHDLPIVTNETLAAAYGELCEFLRYLGYNPTRQHLHKPSQPFQPPLSDRSSEITDMFMAVIAGRGSRSRRSGYVDLHVCPTCGHTDYKAGFNFLPDGGFQFHCHHSSCEFNRTTGWSPGNYPGPRIKKLFEDLGGDPEQLTVWVHEQAKKQRVEVTPQEFIAWMMRD